MEQVCVLGDHPDRARQALKRDISQGEAQALLTHGAAPTHLAGRLGALAPLGEPQRPVVLQTEGVGHPRRSAEELGQGAGLRSPRGGAVNRCKRCTGFEGHGAPSLALGGVSQGLCRGLKIPIDRPARQVETHDNP